MKSSTLPPGRYVFLDGLRAVACLGVLFHHLYHCSEYEKAFSLVSPHWFEWVAAVSARGVQIFFVLSGFVIAYSVRDLQVTPRTAGNFALRRQLRLDPTLWVCISLVVAETIVMARAHPDAVAYPTAKGVIANLLYLPGVLGLPMYPGAVWTLCLEVQFYLLFILIVGIFQRSSSALTLAVGVVGAWSLAFRTTVPNDAYPWFVGSFYLFAAGVLCFWTLAGRCPSWVFIGFATAVLCVGFGYRQDGVVVGGLTAAVIYGVGKAGRLSQWLGNPVIQYLGAISYSLYLIQGVVFSRVYKIGLHITGVTLWGGIMSAVIGAALSIAAAHILHVMVERPSLQFANKFKPKRITEENAPKPTGELVPV